MNTCQRAILVVVATLMIGVVIGALVVGPLVARQHFRHLDKLRTRQGFAGRLEEIIKPDGAQAGPVREILTKYSAQFEELNTQYHASTKALADSLRKNLDPILTDVQRDRLERDRSRHKPPHKPR
ncbi:MAG: hypothetical protein V1694_13140 [Candidatus Eisenbacteria bacterium]